MDLLLALAIFLGIAAVTWAVAVALHQTFLGGPDLLNRPDFLVLSAIPVILVALTSLVPFPGGYLLSLIAWWLAAKNLFDLPTGHAVALFLILAVLSYLTRLMVYGALTAY